MYNLKRSLLFALCFMLAADAFAFYPLKDDGYDVEDKIVNQEPITITLLLKNKEKAKRYKNVLEMSINDWFDNVLIRKDKYPDFDNVFKDILPVLRHKVNIHFKESKKSYVEEKFAKSPFTTICGAKDTPKTCKAKIKKKYGRQIPFTDITLCYDALFYENTDLLFIDFEREVLGPDGTVPAGAVYSEAKHWMGERGKNLFFKDAAPEEYPWMHEKNPYHASCIEVEPAPKSYFEYMVIIHELGHAFFNLGDQYKKGMERISDTSNGNKPQKSIMNFTFGGPTCDDADGLVYSLYKRKYGKEPNFPSFCDYGNESYSDLIGREEFKKRL